MWWLPLAAIAVGGLYLTGAGRGTFTLAGFLEIAAGRVALVFPFAAFAGGLSAASLAGPMGRRVGVLARAVAIMAVLSYVTDEVVEPIAEYRQDESRGVDVEAVYPFGPDTPDALSRLRTAVVSAGPASYSFSIDDPLRQPPNWLSHLIHQPVAFTILALLIALIGLLVGMWTSGLSPPRRRHSRWALGLSCAIVSFVPIAAASQWVRASPANSGPFGAWVPLLVPLALLGLAYRVVSRWEAADLRSSSGLGV